MKLFRGCLALLFLGLLSAVAAPAADARLMVALMPKAKGNAYFISC